MNVDREQKWRVAYVLEDKRKTYCMYKGKIESWNFHELAVLNHKKVIKKDLGAFTKDLKMISPIYKQAIQIFGKNNIVKIVDFEVDEINQPINKSIIHKR
tara:strand:- start:3128 stop:3427 length:300 start_codon:yes stop_codon:yes gene_type:complete